MPELIVLPADVVQVIATIKATPIDPSDFQNAVQECYNRGFGVQGKWIAEHKDLYLQALQVGYISESEIPEPEPVPSIPPVVNPEDAGKTMVARSVSKGTDTFGVTTEGNDVEPTQDGSPEVSEDSLEEEVESEDKPKHRRQSK